MTWFTARPDVLVSRLKLLASVLLQMGEDTKVSGKNDNQVSL